MIQAEPNIHSGPFNNAEQFPSMSLLKRSTVKQKVDTINSLLTCLSRVHFRGMTTGFFYHAPGFLSPCIAYRFCDIPYVTVIVRVSSNEGAGHPAQIRIPLPPHTAVAARIHTLTGKNVRLEDSAHMR